MSNKIITKKVFSLIESGNLMESVEFLKNEKECLCKDVDFLNIINYCFKLFHKKEIKKEINIKDLLEILFFCSEKIHHLNDDQWKNYLSCVYHILKDILVLQNIRIVDFHSLKKILLPHFWKPNERITYEALCVLMHNTIASTTNQKEAISPSIIFPLTTLTIQMYMKILPLRDLFQTKVLLYIKSISLSAREKLEMLVTLAEKIEFNSDILSSIFQAVKLVTGNLNTVTDFVNLKDCFDIIVRKCVKLEVYTDLVKFSKLLNSFFTLLSQTENCNNENFEETYYDLPKISLKNSYTEEVYYIVVNIVKKINIQPKIPLNVKFLENFAKWTFNFCKQLLMLNSKKCGICEKCFSEKDYQTAIILLTKVGCMVVSFSKKIEISEDLTVKIVKYLTYGCELCVIVKENICKLWKKCWSDLGICIYNLGVVLYKSKPALSYEFWNIFISFSLKLKATEDGAISSELLNKALIGLTEIKIKEKEFKEALYYTALNVLKSSSEENINNALNQWIRIKHSTKECNDLQELTIVLLLKNNSHHAIFLNDDIESKLLIKELQLYKTHWPSKKSMMQVFKELVDKINLDACVRIIVEIWGDCETATNEDFSLIFDEIFEKYNKEVTNRKTLDLETKICLANINVLKYVLEISKLRLKNVNEMNNTAITSNRPHLPHEISPNPDDQCDVVANYSNLNIEMLKNTQKYLDEGREILKDIDFDKSNLNILETLCVSKLVFKIAENYQLNNFSFFTVETLNINMKIAELKDDDALKLECICSILENSENVIVNPESIWLQKGKSIISLRNIDKKLSSLFYIQLSRIYLNNELITEAKKYFQTAKDMCEDISDLHLKIKLNLLHSELLNLPCTYKIEEHGDIFIPKLHKNLLNLSSKIKLQSHCFENIILYFKLIKAIATKFKQLFLPREMRCYTKEALIMSQKLLLPLVSTEFLILLSEADLTSRLYDDCGVKVDGISKILYPNSTSYKFLQSSKEINSQNLIENMSEEGMELVMRSPLKEIRQTFIKIPTPKILINSGSPKLNKRYFTMPDFIKHEYDCTCIHCSNCEIYNYTLKIFCLYALLNYHRKDFDVAKMFFFYANFFHDKTKMKRLSLPRKTNKLLEGELFSDIDIVYWECYFRFLLDFGYFYITVDDMSAAIEMNVKLLNLLADEKKRNYRSYQDAVLQKLELFQLKYLKSSDDADDDEDDDDENKQCLPIIKTPENNRSQILIKNVSLHTVTPPLRDIKPIKIDLTNDTEDEEIVVKSNKADSPFLAFYTPFTTKIKEFETSAKSNKLIRVPDESTIVIPTSPGAYGSITTNMASQIGLKSRTKLLSEKLKKSRKERNENMPNEFQKYDALKKNVRKKLIPEYNEIENDLECISNLNQQLTNEDKKEKNVQPTRKKRGRPPKRI